MASGLIRSLVWVTVALGPGAADGETRAQSGAVAVAVCTVPGEGSARAFRLESDGPAEARRWFLALNDASTKGQWLRVALPGADPRVAPGGVTLDYRSANGGVIVRLEARRDGSMLDVYVSYELEVNIDADLDPRVDLLNTEGLRRDVMCRRGDGTPR